jgi:hypothetical protein
VKTFLIFLAAFGVNIQANTCATFNMKYKFCYESWMTKDVVKVVVDELNRSTIQANLVMKKTEVGDSTQFIMETKNSALIDEISELPSELKEEGMMEAVGKTYGPYLALSSVNYYTAQFKKGLIPKDSLGPKLVRCKYQVDLRSDKGELAKTYDLSKYGLYFVSKLLGINLGENSEDEE